MSLVLVQEDAHAVDLDLDSQTGTALFGIFDGHAGKEVAAFCARRVVGSEGRGVAGTWKGRGEFGGGSLLCGERTWVHGAFPRCRNRGAYM
jgi:hypothetical protein